MNLSWILSFEQMKLQLDFLQIHSAELGDIIVKLNH